MATLTGLAARVLAIGLVAVGLPALASAAPAHAATAVTVQPASPIPGERFTVTGKLTSKVVRPVRLEHRRCIRVGHHTKCTWTKVVEARTSPTGRFALTAMAGKSSVKVRVVAKAVTIRGHHYRRVVSATKLLRPAVQRVSVSIPTTLLAGQSAVARLTLTPARRGRLTQVQALIGGRWTRRATYPGTSPVEPGPYARAAAMRLMKSLAHPTASSTLPSTSRPSAASA